MLIELGRCSTETKGFTANNAFDGIGGSGGKWVNFVIKVD